MGSPYSVASPPSRTSTSLRTTQRARCLFRTFNTTVRVCTDPIDPRPRQGGGCISGPHIPLDVSIVLHITVRSRSEQYSGAVVILRDTRAIQTHTFPLLSTGVQSNQLFARSNRRPRARNRNRRYPPLLFFGSLNRIVQFFHPQYFRICTEYVSVQTNWRCCIR